MLLDRVSQAVGHGFFLREAPPRFVRQGSPVLDTRTPGPLNRQIQRGVSLRRLGIGDNLDVLG